MRTKIRTFILLSLLNIPVLSFAVIVTCPSVKDLNEQLANGSGFVVFEPIGRMTVRQPPESLKNLAVMDWKQVSVRLGFLVCGYKAPNIPEGLVQVSADSRNWREGRPTFPWNDGTCGNPFGTRETCRAIK